MGMRRERKTPTAITAGNRAWESGFRRRAIRHLDGSIENEQNQRHKRRADQNPQRVVPGAGQPSFHRRRHLQLLFYLAAPPRQAGPALGKLTGIQSARSGRIPFRDKPTDIQSVRRRPRYSKPFSTRDERAPTDWMSVAIWPGPVFRVVTDRMSVAFLPDLSGHEPPSGHGHIIRKIFR